MLCIVYLLYYVNKHQEKKSIIYTAITTGGSSPAKTL